MRYFVNVVTGDIFLTDKKEEYKTVFDYPQYSIEGWSEVDETMWELLIKVHNFAWVLGVQDEILTNETDYGNKI